MAHGRPQIPRFGREKWCINVAKPRNFIDFSLQNATVRHFLAFWGLCFSRGVFKTHGIYVGSRFRGINNTIFYHFYDFGSLGGSWAVLGASWGLSFGSVWALCHLLGALLGSHVSLLRVWRPEKAFSEKVFLALVGAQNWWSWEALGGLLTASWGFLDALRGLLGALGGA